MKNEEKFLNLYKEYESIMRDQGLDCKDFEEHCEDTLQNRLRMCRQMRNYLSHNNDAGFLDISNTQIKFLSDFVNEQKIKGDVLKKHLKTPTSSVCDIKDKCSLALEKLNKLKKENIVVTNGTSYKLASVYEISTRAIESKSNKLDKVKLCGDVIFEHPLVEIEKIPSGKIIVCTSDGTTDGKLLGVYYS